MLKILESLILKGFQGFKSFEHKKCPFCLSKSIKRNGIRNGKQRYQCTVCRKRFDGGRRLNPNQLWQLYTDGKQTAQQLADHFHCSRKTISRHLQKAASKNQFATPNAVNLIIDTTYFGRSFGIMVLYDSISNQALSVDEVEYETNALYFEAVQKIKRKGITIQSITCDGRQGLIQMFPDLPIQLCQFHQLKTINRYLTRKPKTAAAQDLKAIALTLKSSTCTQFQEALNRWLEEHKNFLNERTVNPETGQSHYTHKRLRSAFNSLKRNMEHLFTFERFAELDIPKTSNLLEGRFGDMKQKLRCHQGMRRDNKIRFIKDYFSVSRPK